MLSAWRKRLRGRTAIWFDRSGVAVAIRLMVEMISPHSANIPLTVIVYWYRIAPRIYRPLTAAVVVASPSRVSPVVIVYISGRPAATMTYITLPYIVWRVLFVETLL